MLKSALLPQMTTLFYVVSQYPPRSCDLGDTHLPILAFPRIDAFPVSGQANPCISLNVLESCIALECGAESRNPAINDSISRGFRQVRPAPPSTPFRPPHADVQHSSCCSTRIFSPTNRDSNHQADGSIDWFIPSSVNIKGDEGSQPLCTNFSFCSRSDSKFQSVHTRKDIRNW